ncbi:MAG TPA: nucleotide-binding protein [Pyrinomonadaceae bacterium]|nr:nucleotide-binding protein [Pyrinomonadaceae bacterium]
MAKPKLFIGSSQKNLRVAKLIAEALEDCAHVKVWDEDVFGLNRGNLETLLKQLEEYDFAVFVLAADDMTASKDETKHSPRDNVLFESGLFMGVLGRERVFLVYDEAVPLKIPSDLAGITLAGFDGSRIAEGESAVRTSCRKISEAITAARFPHLVGDWRSVYPLTFEEGSPMVEEILEIRPGRNGLSFVTKTSSLQDYYTAFGHLALERQIIGKWKSREESNDMEGVFVLTVNPTSNIMYGYFTSPDEIGGVVYAMWVLAKMAGADEARVAERLKKAEELLKQKTVLGPSNPEGDRVNRTSEPIAQTETLN